MQFRGIVFNGTDIVFTYADDYYIETCATIADHIDKADMRHKLIGIVYDSAGGIRYIYVHTGDDTGIGLLSRSDLNHPIGLHDTYNLEYYPL